MNLLPTQIAVTIDDVRSIACGSNHSLLLSADGRVFSFGRGNFGQQGNGTLEDQKTPTIIKIFQQVEKVSAFNSSFRIDKVTAGAETSFAIDGENTLFAWGWNAHAQLGFESNPTVTEPVRVKFSTPVVEVSAGAVHSAVICTDGHVYTFGRDCMPKMKGGGGRLGHGRQLSLHGIRDEVEEIAEEKTRSL
eukprot:765871-Hanusia_phi.AAC.4